MPLIPLISGLFLVQLHLTLGHLTDGDGDRLIVQRDAGVLRLGGHLTGPLAKLTEHPTDTGDYIWATLTDPTPLPDAMAALRAAYPNAMRLDYQPRGAAAAPTDAALAVRGKPFAELFQDFFTQMNGRPLTIEEARAVKQLREEAAKA